MCLDHSAHGLRANHAIFQGPLPVQITYDETPTPEGYRSWPGGAELGPTMQTWRVQTRGFSDGRDENGERVEPGIVATPEGFLDSPDAEIVSGGLNMKGPRSVAIGRHGNLTLWGFHARPDRLTPDARNAFVNTVVWTAGFDGQRPLVRNVARSRDGVEGVLSFSRAIRTSWDSMNEWIDEQNAELEALRAEAATRELDDDERQRLEGVPRKKQSFEAFAEERLRRYHGDERFELFGTDVDAHARWYEEHLEYLVWNADDYRFDVDPNALALGLSNREVDSLYDAIDLIVDADETDDEIDEQSARALVFLARYTGQALGTRDEWTAWLDQVEERLFFSDVGGYRFFVEPLPPGAIEPPDPGNDKVSFAASLVDGDDGPQLVLRVRLAPGWHLYDRVPPSAPYTVLSIDGDLAGPLSARGAWTRPRSAPYPGTPGITVWEHRVEFTRAVNVDSSESTADLGSISIAFQVCDDQRCLRPTQLEVPIVDRREAR
ncbi:hypothetical protein Pla163_24980 [Planctomycetes bacterium Pla163]|uniref:Thiol:disulfide interchange protein DsbD N-terminal domain-containing protein n=1 Tax=Rohdeia mirabilis TaxID=2528008 RepID=A0A518D1M3_9BACT|nr:hypothetical protein Pla163_24980 [Planctomycetes bacterium Pla163]